MRLYILGDSHVNVYCHLCSYLESNYQLSTIIHHIDAEVAVQRGVYTPFLMNTIGSRGQEILRPYIDEFQSHDLILYVFGEPDVRIHINKQTIKYGREEDEIIDTLAKTYVAKIREITPALCTPIIRYVLPPREFSMFNSVYTPNGTLIERQRYTSKINQKLKMYCEKQNVLFYDNILKDQLISQEGELKAEYTFGETHYNSVCVPILIKEFDIFLSSNNLKLDSIKHSALLSI